MKNQKKTLILMSGGLDSILAAKIMMEQGLHVEGIHFWIGFAGTEGVEKAASHLGIPLHIVDVVEEFKTVVLNPVHGYGAHLNPCLDCKVFMVKKAKEWMEKHEFDFLVTGEVVGQRPKSQRRDTMPIAPRESGIGDRLLRPLSAKLLPLTLPEKEGWVDREQLYGFSGRSRKPQMNLAKELGVSEYQQPAGGCLLTDRKFCDRMLALWEFQGEKNYTKEDIELFKIGRHLKPDFDFRMIVGRDQKENEQLEAFFEVHSRKDLSCHSCEGGDPDKSYKILKTISHPGPVVLINGKFDPEKLAFIAKIAARFSAKGRQENQVEFELKSANQKAQTLFAKALDEKEIPKNWYI